MEQDRVRAFVAVRMSEEVEAALAALIDELQNPGDGIKWVARANLHVTLKFLGAAVERAQLAALAASLRALAAETAPFHVLARGAGAFPNMSRPRALWARLESAELAALAARVEDAAASAGFARETRRWSPHLTIGRVRAPRGLGRIRRAMAELAEREFGRSRIASLTLYRSTLTPNGALYDPLETFPLAPRS